MGIFSKPIYQYETDPMVILGELAAQRLGYMLAKNNPGDVDKYNKVIAEILVTAGTGDLNLTTILVNQAIKLAGDKFGGDPLLPLEIATVAKLIGIKFASVTLPVGDKLGIVKLLGEAFQRGMMVAK